jgi:hypothetical protein
MTNAMSEYDGATATSIGEWWPRDADSMKIVPATWQQLVEETNATPGSVFRVLASLVDDGLVTVLPDYTFLLLAAPFTHCAKV